ncbi:ATP-binding protein [Streptomyces sp. NPDC048518]|uniref:ATP-binding protein n=1 Tax=Streptomyces sp. NPDC048518 TaxID=3155029 RepID=UPI003405AE48
MPLRQLVVGAMVSALVAWLLWSLLYNSYLGEYWIWPLLLLTPESWLGTMAFVWSSYIYYAIVGGGIAIFFGRLGGWPELLRRVWGSLRGPGGVTVDGTVTRVPTPAPEADPARWVQMRADGAFEVADRLSEELHGGLMSDLDYARIDHAWRSGRARTEITREVLAQGAAACVHGSGQRDIPTRTARHDLVLRQVRIGAAVDSPRNPYRFRTVGVALDPAVLGTSALVVGPPDAAARVVRPVLESACLQALAGQAAVVAVTSAGAGAPRDAAFDVVLRAGDPESAYGLDLYGGTDDVDEASGIFAEALVGDLAEAGELRRATMAVAQLIGPWRALHDRFPGIPQLRDLLDDDAARADLRASLDERGLSAQVRELNAFERRSAGPGGPAEGLATRVALLDRPAFEGFLVEPAAGGGVADGAFSLRLLDRPVRVRIDLPERVHAEASRILARLVIAQFTARMSSRRDTSVFALLALEDAVHTITPNSLRGLQQLRTRNAGVLLNLRSLSDVPEHVREHLLSSVGVRMALSGVSPWDAQYFASAWGTEWVETEAVTHRQVRADEPMTKVMHGLRKIVTGKHVTTQSVTVSRQERQRWSASDLANELQPGQAVISMTAVTGDRTPPLLTELGG